MATSQRPFLGTFHSCSASSSSAYANGCFGLSVVRSTAETSWAFIISSSYSIPHIVRNRLYYRHSSSARASSSSSTAPSTATAPPTPCTTSPSPFPRLSPKRFSTSFSSSQPWGTHADTPCSVGSASRATVSAPCCGRWSCSARVSSSQRCGPPSPPPCWAPSPYPCRVPAPHRCTAPLSP